ncbi:hypothetical protein, partial [Burkholderia diffusa]|uniref:hypothetical protein n=1 Tax=Burkholderia diffusa TaxID=488732 RepID=UPI001BA60F0E
MKKPAFRRAFFGASTAFACSAFQLRERRSHRAGRFRLARTLRARRAAAGIAAILAAARRHA